MMGVIKYDSNNSGGHWRLTDDNWRALEEAGWVVHWIHDENDPSHEHEPPDPRWGSLASFSGHSHGWGKTHQLTRVASNGERWLGALARSAAKETTDPAAAVAEFEAVTGACASDEGCNCCGSPHSFTYTDDDGERHYSSVYVTGTEMRWD